ncbi:MAG: DNA-3-methyladenine glycosylase [Synergistaceae bacterium]|jgi:DNA-3-methyladenine glycosylase|nr:DNA-3-methyladenine glycosylase [Synergistaceae bacterium]
MDDNTLDREFYMEGAAAVARKLLGKILISRSPEGETSGMITETEAYAGREDAACHAYKRQSPSAGHRTNIMFGPGGYAYVYLIYGMYRCFNVVTNIRGLPEAVLIRALEPRDGVKLMRSRRNTAKLKDLCGGPGKLCQALDITLADYGADLCGGRISVTQGEDVPDGAALATRRINIDYAGEASGFPYRFVIKESDFLSTRRYVKRARRKTDLSLGA